MIISNLTGGLGNQMFQYAFGRYLAIKNKTELKLHFTNALFNTRYDYGLHIFQINAEIATSNDLKKFGVFKNRIINRVLYLIDERLHLQFNKNIITQRYPYSYNSKFLEIRDNMYVQGYWADERYIKGMRDILLHEFMLKEKLDEKNLKTINQMRKTMSVSIHVRRGDLMTNKLNIPRFIGSDYYIDAINKIRKIVLSPIFFVFSDDIDWCRLNLSRFANMKFINHNTGFNSYKDLILMSNCKHNIVANSTFSWWSAWLNINKNKKIISPKFLSDSIHHMIKL